MEQNLILEKDLMFEDWGLVPYQEALERQLERLEQIAASQGTSEIIPGSIIFLSHPDVVTLGRATQSGDVTDFKGPILEVSRGGRATYHGPSQLVIYPIVDLSSARKGRKAQEVVGLVRVLEESIIEVLADYGVACTGKSIQKKWNEEFGVEETGVWYGNRKIASLGLAVKKWISYHGAAINLDFDPKAFKGLNPCGFRSDTMISLEEILGHKIDRQDFKNKMKQKLVSKL